MLSKNSAHINESLSHLGKLSGYAQKILKILLIVYLVLAIPVYCYGAIHVFGSGSNSFEIALRLIPDALSIVIPSLVFIVLVRIFGDIFIGNSPFTVEQSKRLRLIGFLMLADIVFIALSSATPFPETHIGTLTLGIVPPEKPEGITIDVSSLLWAILCFCFSCVFRYGALLQQLSDETV